MSKAIAAAIALALTLTLLVVGVARGAGTGFEICTVAAECKAGLAGGLGGEMRSPGDVATDSDGNVYVADTGNDRVQKFDSDGNWERAWGRDVVSGGGTGFEICTVAADCKPGTSGGLGGHMDFPTSIAVGQSGNVYVADSSNHRIQKFNSFGAWESAWGKDVVSGGGTGFEVCTVAASCKAGATGGLGGEMAPPAGIAAGGLGADLVFVAEANRVQAFDGNGGWQRAWGKDVISGGGTGFEVCTVAPDCKSAAFGSLGGEMLGPREVATDVLGLSVFVADEGNLRIQRFDNSGSWNRAWGKDVVTGGGAGFEVCTVAANCKQGAFGGLGGEMTVPADVAIDSVGRVYVADSLNQRIQRFDLNGVWNRAWGKDVVSGGATDFEICTFAPSCKAGLIGGLGGEMRTPFGVASLFGGNVYVADSENHRMQRFDTTGVWQRAWGKDVVVDPPAVDPPAAPAPPPPKPARLLSARLKGKSLLLRLRCSPGGGDCAGNTVALRTRRKLAVAGKRRHLPLGRRRSFSLLAGQTATIRSKLSRRARKLLRRRRIVPARVRITGGGQTSVTTVKVRGRRGR